MDDLVKDVTASDYAQGIVGAKLILKVKRKEDMGFATCEQ